MINFILFIIFASKLVAQIDYLTEIQTIFDNNCIGCHVDGGAYSGGLYLSLYELAMEGRNSGNSTVPFEHSSSEIIYKNNF